MIKNTKEREYSASAFGAKGIAVVGETLHCPARIHAGWRSGASQTAQIWRPRKDVDRGVDTLGIQAAIDEAHRAGGGVVRIEPGDYFVTPIRLRSHVRLCLEAGATLFASPDAEDYTAWPQIRQEDMDRAYRETGGSGHSGYVTGNAFDTAIFSAEGCENTGISGPGKVSAQGGAWFIPWWLAEKGFTLVRPMRFLEFRNCSNVLVEDLRIEDSCGWTLVFRECNGVRIAGGRIRNLHGPNVDGIDVVACRGVEVRDCDIFTTDDGICLKSVIPDGVVEDVSVRNCRVRTCCNAFKIGTETLGTVRDVSVRDLEIYNLPDDPLDAGAGICVASCDGGLVENVSVENVSMSGTRMPFLLYVGRRSLYQSKYRPPRAGVLKHVSLSRLTATRALLPSVISGLSQSRIEEVTLSDSRFDLPGGSPEATPLPPETPEGYPSLKLFQSLPAAGLWIRETDGCRLENVAFELAEPDARPHIRLDGSRNATRDGEPISEE